MLIFWNGGVQEQRLVDKNVISSGFWSVVVPWRHWGRAGATPAPCPPLCIQSAFIRIHRSIPHSANSHSDFLMT